VQKYILLSFYKYTP